MGKEQNAEKTASQIMRNMASYKDGAPMNEEELALIEDLIRNFVPTEGESKEPEEKNRKIHFPLG